MDRLIELLREAQDGKTQAQFAAMLGITQSMLSKVYAGNRRPGKGVISGLCRVLPAHSQEIQSLFFGSEYDATHDAMSEGIAERQVVPEGRPA